MKRLTIFDGEFWVHKNFPPVEEDRIDEFIDCVKELAARLAAYEDTGLEPEEIVKNGMMLEDSRRYSGRLELKLKAYEELGSIDRLRELAQADREGRCVVLNMPREPLVWGDNGQDTCLCPYCGKDLMGIPYGERMVLQCPECGQYLDATKAITREEAEAARREQE